MVCRTDIPLLFVVLPRSTPYTPSWLSCSCASLRKILPSSTPYAPPWLSYSAGSPITLPPAVLLCGVPDNTPAICLALAHPCARFSPPLHSTLYTLHSPLAVLFLRFPSQDIPLPLRLTLSPLPSGRDLGEAYYFYVSNRGIKEVI